MKTPAQQDAEHIWQILVTLVMDTRGDWKRKVTEATGLPFSRIRALTRIEDGPRMLGELAYDMNIDAPAATVIINDLEARGLVERRAHPQNRRAKLVSLSAEGRKMVEAVNRVTDPPPALLTALSAQELAELRRIFEGDVS